MLTGDDSNMTDTDIRRLAEQIYQRGRPFGLAPEGMAERAADAIVAAEIFAEAWKDRKEIAC